MTEMNHDDVEAQLSHQASGHAPTIEHDDDDDCSFDGMEVEDWLIKQQAKKPDGWDQEALKRAEAKATDECLRSITSSNGRSKEISPQEEQKMTSMASDKTCTIAELPPPTGCTGTGTRTETFDPTVILDAEANALASYENFVVAEVSPHSDQVLVVEGVKSMDPRRRRIFTLLGTVVLAAFLAIAAGLITNLFTSSSSSPKLAAGGAENMTTAPIPNTITSRGGNLSVTIGDVWASFSPGGIENFIVVNGALDVFQKLVSQTDKTFTFFSASKQADVMGGIGVALITKGLSRMYNGHVLCGMESLLVEGTVVFEDMYDGMVLQSVAGYPLLIQLNPLRVNNNPIIPTEVNLFYKNGVVHTTYEFPKPLAPWFGKSVYDVLLETNEARNDDLSTFVAMIESYPKLKGKLQSERALEGLTLFVPTNNGIMATVDQNVLLADPTLFQDFLWNHVVGGNFVRRCWWTIPTGTQVSETELTLETQAEKILSLEINDVVIINGDVTIIQEDIFSIEGMIQVIDKPLLN